MNDIGSLITHRPTCLALIAAGGIHVALTATGLPGWQCPFRAATGFPCPGCGLTRGCLLLLSGHFREAMVMHAFAPLAVAGLAFIGAGMVLPARLRRSFVRQIEQFDRSYRVASALLALLLAYWMSRLILDASP